MRVISAPHAPADDPEGKLTVVDVEPVRRLARPVPLSVIKGDALLADWDLVRLPRLSVVPVLEITKKRL